MSKHDENKRLICPHCHKRFGTEQGAKAHMKRKKHTTHHHVPEPWAKYAEGPAA